LNCLFFGFFYNPDIRFCCNLGSAISRNHQKGGNIMSVWKKEFLIVVGLIVATSAALAYLGTNGTRLSLAAGNSIQAADNLVTVKAEMVQQKVLKGSDGKVAVSLILAADEVAAIEDHPEQPMDLVIVLDRSGSMRGQKIRDARQAVIQLVERLNTDDRFALITYANGAETASPLLPVDPVQRRSLIDAARQVPPGGGTNLGAGLQRGIDILMTTPATGRQRKVILISDGLANQGVTDPAALGGMASEAVEHNFSVSTAGVGLDFNETLMAAIADQGAGQYHFIEDPRILAQAFEKEFHLTRNVAASSLEIRISLDKGVRLVNAGGYPIRQEKGTAVIHPGDLLSGQKRKLFLTFLTPTDMEKKITLGRIQMSYRHRDGSSIVKVPDVFTVACVPDPNEVVASIDKDAWGSHVVQEEYSLLKKEVAGAIREGNRLAAEKFIRDYETKAQAINTAVGSAEVAENLKNDVEALRKRVQDTFTGTPAAVAIKKKQQSKVLQYDSYRTRRDKK
jgi:Ca-activated chloride channel family protein